MVFHLHLITNKPLDALTNIIKTSREYIPKYLFRYSQVFMHTDGQTEGI
jgi:hypothetical protein